MVDDHTQRPYRSNETVARGAPAKAQPSGSDPLAELARLIGQNDPFSEFGRDGTRRVAPPRAPEPAHDWDAQPAGAGFAPPPAAPDPRGLGAGHRPQPDGNDDYEPARGPAANPPNFGRQQFGSAPLAGGNDLYRTGNEPHPYDEDAYDPNHAQLGNEQDDFYDDEPPTRRRMGVLVIAGVFALAVIGTAGAFGYRALFGTSTSSGPPPVIKADSAPIKIVPASTQSGKQITDRINDKGIGEKLVSREEQPVAVSPQPQDAGASSSAPALGSGIVGSEPKKVRTIAIRPDQPNDAAPASAAQAEPTPSPQQPTRAAALPQQPARAAAPPPPAKPAAPPRVVATAPPAAEDPEPTPPPAPRAPVVRAAPPVQQQAAGNAPLSLSPDAAPAPARAAPARATQAPVRAAVAAPTQTAPAAAASSGAGGYAVQVSSQRSEAEAQAAFRSLQTKFPGQLGGKEPMIRKVELGDKGTYFRAMVPAGSSAEAAEMCNGMKAAGGSCIIQRN